jgi:hypothetical protein
VEYLQSIAAELDEKVKMTRTMRRPTGHIILVGGTTDGGRCKMDSDSTTSTVVMNGSDAMKWQDRVVNDPKVLVGNPVIKGT